MGAHFYSEEFDTLDKSFLSSYEWRTVIVISLRDKNALYSEGKKQSKLSFFAIYVS